jgi:hypothetical protein
VGDYTCEEELIQDDLAQGAFTMSKNSTCFWLFASIYITDIREKVILSRKCDTVQKAVIDLLTRADKTICINIYSIF